MENLKLYNNSSCIDNYNIAKSLIELSGVESTYSEDLADALYYIDACAQNEKNSDYFRVLYNTLIAISDNYTNFLNQY